MSLNGWTDSLARQLKLPAVNLYTSPPPSQNPGGQFWRAALAQYIFSDLSAGLRSGRRFVRLDYPGLSGIILYQYPTARPDDVDQLNMELTVDAVFGNASDPKDLGMDIEEVIDLVDARLRPTAAPHGFIVNSALTDGPRAPVKDIHFLESSLLDMNNRSRSLSEPLLRTPTESDKTPRAFEKLYSKTTVAAAIVKCARSASEPALVDAVTIEDNAEEEKAIDAYMDTSMSANDSLGPSTPPRFSDDPNHQTQSPPSFSDLELAAPNYILSDMANFLHSASPPLVSSMEMDLCGDSSDITPSWKFDPYQQCVNAAQSPPAFSLNFIFLHDVYFNSL